MERTNLGLQWGYCTTGKNAAKAKGLWISSNIFHPLDGMDCPFVGAIETVPTVSVQQAFELFPMSPLVGPAYSLVNNFVSPSRILWMIWGFFLCMNLNPTRLSQVGARNNHFTVCSTTFMDSFVSNWWRSPQEDLVVARHKATWGTNTELCGALIVFTSRQTQDHATFLTRFTHLGLQQWSRWCFKT